jgi:hypothetical protein
MIAELILAPEAVQDIAEGYAWYEDRRPGLGEDFLTCEVQEACFRFEAAKFIIPLQWPNVNSGNGRICLDWLGGSEHSSINLSLVMTGSSKDGLETR